MKCWHCGTDNPASNKFCGECGRPQIAKPTQPSYGGSAQASEISHSPAGSAGEPPSKQTLDVSIQQHNPLVEEPRVTHESPQQLAAPHEVENSPLHFWAADRQIAEQITRTRHEGVRAAGHAGGPSIFGLNDEPESDSSYLLEDEPPQRSVSRVFVLFLVLAVLGFFAYRNWDYIRNEGRSLAASSRQVNQQASRAENAASAPQRQETGTISDENRSSAEPAAAAAQPESTAEKSAPEGKGNEVAGNATPAEGDAAQSRAIAKPESDQTDAKPALNDNADERARQNTVESAGAKAEARKPAADNAKVDMAQRYIQGRGVPQDCNRGFILLRQSADESNPHAMIQLGALYATGQCVEQDRAQAYQWFRQAQKLDSGNFRLQEMLNRMWSDMTPAERKRAEGGD